MKNLNFLAFSLLSAICISMTVACTSQDEPADVIQDTEDSNQPHTCELVLNVTRSGFDDEPQTRAGSEWSDGDKIYLTFSVENGTTYGDATYDNGKWSVNYYGALTEGETAKCKAVFFETADTESGSVINLTENTAIYEDTDGAYVFNGNDLSVTADLKPKTGRIRFAGKDNDEITIYGISHYTSYDCSTGKFAISSVAIKSKVTASYTPYIYGEFSDADLPRINLITSTWGFTRIPSKSIYQPGESGYMTIPTETSHDGWQNSLILKVNGVEFTMIPVEYEDGNFLLGETEVTRELYEAIMQNGSYSDAWQCPAGGQYSTFESFLSKLRYITELPFRFPTADEWKFAAKGGKYSHNYTYSGSNIIADVAWYKENSNNKTHEVKSLQPNELGFYDMSGNVAEYVQMETTQTYVYYYGGGYNKDANACTVTSNNSSYYGDINTGLRIAISK